MTKRRVTVCVMLVLVALLTAFAVRAASRRHTNSVEVLVDAAQVFPAVLDLIHSAQDEVLVSVYMLGGTEGAPGSITRIGQEIVDALAERKEAGVRVRVLTTQFRSVPDAREAGAFSPVDVWLHPVFAYAMSKGIPILRPAADSGTIDHTKYLVVDGREAIFGGMNLADAVASNHDMMVRVRGPAAGVLQQAFAASWGGAVAAHGPDPRESSDIPLVKAESWSSRAKGLWSEGASGCEIQLFVNTPKSHTLEPALVKVIQGLISGDQLQVAMLLFTDDTLVDAVIAAHKRGVEITVVVDPERALYGVDCVTADNASSVAKLTKAGVPTRFYAVAAGQEMHMKVFVATHGAEQIWGVGSANWAGSDMARNSEVYGIFSQCPEQAKQVSEQLEADFATHSDPPTAEQSKCFGNTKCRAELRKTCGARLRTSWLHGRE